LQASAVLLSIDQDWEHAMQSARLFLIAVSLLSCGVVAAANASAQRCVGRATQPVALLELYTSEGCSSCPPADRWLSTFKSNPMLNEQVVPLALHVDYWDYIGWKDRFADPRFSARQNAEVSRAGSRLIVTPQVMLNGHPLSGDDWNQDLQRALDKQRGQPAAAELELVATRVDGGWSVALNGRTPQVRKLHVFLVRYEQGLSSNVAAGENKGVRLDHDFVVRGWEGPLAVQSSPSFALSHVFRLDGEKGQTGFAAVVEDADSGLPIQSVATRVCS
jgi:hypothetical protein